MREYTPNINSIAMIKVLIIEDEIPARKKLKRFIDEINIPVDIVGEIATVEGAIEFLNRSGVDLIFSDIELLDGNAFEIFSKTTIHCPIIFTTAYDQFWMNAFESNGIDYLLKPFSKERFQKAWNKFESLGASNTREGELLSRLQHILETRSSELHFKKRFTISSHHGIYFINIENIVYFEAAGGVVFAFEAGGKKHLLSEPTLKAVEIQVNPVDYFRINRSELINKRYIEKIERFTKNILAVKLTGIENYFKTSQSNTAAFREWLKS